MRTNIVVGAVSSTETGARSLHPIGHPLQQCPSCRSEDLEPVVETDTLDVHVLCRECKRCWHVELGHVHRMSPYVCHGCPQLSQGEPVFDADRSGPVTSVPPFPRGSVPRTVGL